jgi:hypothetical protein
MHIMQIRIQEAEAVAVTEGAEEVAEVAEKVEVAEATTISKATKTVAQVAEEVQGVAGVVTGDSVTLILAATSANSQDT